MSVKGLQIQVLGELVVLVDGRPVEVPGSRKTRALLAYLLLQDRPVTREHLCELLWPHPDNPRAALRWSLTKLRPVLNADDEHLVADRTSVAVVGMSEMVDLGQVQDLLTGPLADIATPVLEAAAARFHGELLDGLDLPDCYRFYEWLVARRESVRKLRRSILETLTTRHADTPEAALVHARARVELDPLDEGAHVDVVRLLGALGRLPEARAQADRCREILDRELDVAPPAALADALRTMKKVPVEVPAPVVAPTPARPGPQEAGLFGRADECVSLANLLEPATTGDGRSILLLEGEPGIGKTRLLDEFERRALDAGGIVLRGRSWEAEIVRPFGAWIDLLAALPDADVPDVARADLAHLAPRLGSPGDHSGDEQRIFDAVGTLLAHLAAAHPIVALVFDDLHWIDPASAALLSSVSRSRTNGQVVMACAARPGEFADNDAARSLLRGWNRAGVLERIAVGPLSGRDAAALARSLASTEDVERIVARSGGNPLYVIEVAREGGRSGGSITSLVADRLTTLPEPSVEVARWAAVLGHEVSASRLAALVDLPLNQLLEATGILERHGILRSGGDNWDFTHDLLRKATYGALSGPRRTLMHRQVARTIADEPDPDGSLAGDLAYHATRGGEHETAARAAIVAGDRALRLAAMEHAFALADRGLRDLSRTVTAARIELHIELLRVMVLAGLGRRRGPLLADELGDLADRARVEGRHAAERTARYLLSVVSEEAGDFDAARDHSLEAEQAGRAADPETRLRALANTARCLVQLEREPDRAAALLKEAAHLAKELDAQVLDIPWGLGLLRALEGDDTGAREALERGVALASQRENHWALFECLARLSMLDLAGGNGAAVVARDPQLREVASRLGEGSEMPFTETLLALAVRREVDGPDQLEPALDALRAADTKGMLAYALNVAADQDLAAGDAASASRRAQEALAAATDVGRRHQMAWARVHLGRAGVTVGDLEEAQSHADQAGDIIASLSAKVAAYAELRRLQETLNQDGEKNP